MERKKVFTRLAGIPDALFFSFYCCKTFFYFPRTSNLYGKSIDFDTKYGNIIQGSIVIREGDTKHDYIHFPMRLPYHFFCSHENGIFVHFTQSKSNFMADKLRIYTNTGVEQLVPPVFR